MSRWLQCLPGLCCIFLIYGMKTSSSPPPPPPPTPTHKPETPETVNPQGQLQQQYKTRSGTSRSSSRWDDDIINEHIIMRMYGIKTSSSPDPPPPAEQMRTERHQPPPPPHPPHPPTPPKDRKSKRRKQRKRTTVIHALA